MLILKSKWAFVIYYCGFLFFQAEDGIRDLVRSRGLGDVYKRQDESPSMKSVSPGAKRRVTAWRVSISICASAALVKLSLIHI